MHFAPRSYKSNHRRSPFYSKTIPFRDLQKFAYLMCLMVCASNLYITTSAVTTPRVWRENKTGLVRMKSLHLSTKLLAHKQGITVFHPEILHTRLKRTPRSRTTNSDELHTTRDEILDSQKYDCDHFSTHVLPLISRKKPCFLGTVPTRIAVEEGERIALQCIVYNVNFSTVVISWWKEGRFHELTLGLETYSARYRLPRMSYQDWSLQISDARTEDSGIYACQINLEQIMEKFFEVQVTRKPKPIEISKSSEHEFVKDEAPPQGMFPQMRIEGQNEGFEGSTIRLSCIVQNGPISSATTLVWSHGNGPQRYFLAPTVATRTDLEYLLRSQTSADSDGRFSVARLDVRVAGKDYLQITASREGNHTMRTELIFKKLKMDHAGVWRCSKFTLPAKPNTEEAKMIVYVRSRRPAIRSQMSPSIDGKKANSAPLLPHDRRYWIQTEWLSLFLLAFNTDLV